MVAFLEEHQRKLRQAVAAREVRLTKIRQRNLEWKKAEAFENTALRAIDGVFDIIAPLVKSVARHSTKEPQHTEKPATP